MMNLGGIRVRDNVQRLLNEDMLPIIGSNLFNKGE